MRGVEAELDGGLVGVVSEDGEQVADLLLAGVDVLAGGGTVDGVGDVLAELLELAAELLEERLGRELGLGVHGCLLAGTGGRSPRRDKGKGDKTLRLGYDFPEDLPRPRRSGRRFSLASTAGAEVQ